MTRPRQTRLAAYALITDADRVLLCRLSAHLERWAGHWTLPGGGVEFGESPEHAMIREVAEETGLEVEAQGVIGIDSVVDRSGIEDRHGIRIVYRARIVGGGLRPETLGTTDLSAWHPLDIVSELPVVELVKTGLRLLRDER